MNDIITEAGPAYGLLYMYMYVASYKPHSLVNIIYIYRQCSVLHGV